MPLNITVLLLDVKLFTSLQSSDCFYSLGKLLQGCKSSGIISNFLKALHLSKRGKLGVPRSRGEVATLSVEYFGNIEKIKLIYQHLRVQVHLSTYFSRKKQLSVTEATLPREVITHYEESLGALCHLIPSSQVDMILKP